MFARAVLMDRILIWAQSLELLVNTSYVTFLSVEHECKYDEITLL
jgi:hypothetical protein